MKAILALVACSAVALGAPVEEVEPNDTLATAQFIGEEFYPFGAVAISGSLIPEDMDVFSFDVEAGDFVVVNVFSLDPLGDAVLGIFAPDDTLYALVDDSVGLNPFWDGVIPESGNWKLVVSGNDEDIFGSHDESFEYLASWKIPEPTAVALVAIGLLGLTRRRRGLGSD
ncbi:MAG: PEP-CTERM sorting domain-containing protein [Planctomycetes bacterium]|nr:PEP-CTERM sorting domain-containing protein [Planctomycetota bacterium]